MGSWNNTIMGGDGPLDIACHINSILGEPVEDLAYIKAPNLKISRILSSRQSDIVKLFQEENHSAGNIDIYGQVLGFLMISHGAHMTAETKTWIVESCEADEWALEDKERAVVIAEFTKEVEGYHNVAKPLSHGKGLFQLMAENMNEEKPKLDI